MVDLFIII
ncbi:hypothetical protein YPPY66_2561, partial [Yersinia pestis PY-66]